MVQQLQDCDAQHQFLSLEFKAYKVTLFQTRSFKILLDKLIQDFSDNWLIIYIYSLHVNIHSRMVDL